MITENNFIIINSVVKNMRYLCASKPIMQKKLMSNDYRKQIQMHLTWFENKMRPKTGRVCNMLARLV